MLQLPESVLKHSVGVAEFMAEYAENYLPNADPDEYYIVGLLHDIGKIHPNKVGKNNYKNHARIGGEMLKDLGFVKYKDIFHHGHPEDGYFSQMWLVLNYADLSVDHNGKRVPVMNRLRSIKERYGEASEEFIHASEMFKILTDNGIFDTGKDIV